LINPYNLFFIVNVFHHTSRKSLGETLKLPRLSRVWGVSRSRPTSRKLQRLVSSRSRLRRSRAHPCCRGEKTEEKPETLYVKIAFTGKSPQHYTLQCRITAAVGL